MALSALEHIGAVGIDWIGTDGKIDTARGLSRGTHGGERSGDEDVALSGDEAQAAANDDQREVLRVGGPTLAPVRSPARASAALIT